MKIAFIGAGKVSTALGLYFKSKNFEIQGYYSRNYESAREAATLTKSLPYKSLEDLIADSKMVWITTPDDQIKTVVHQISKLVVTHKNKPLFLHASGVHSLSILNPLKEMGCKTACAHPLLAFGEPLAMVEKLKDVWFVIEEAEKGNQRLSDFFKACGNKTLEIESDKKPLYHAAACILSNYLVTLMNVSHDVFEKSGLPKESVQQATRPLLESVVDNLKDKNCKDALTGPIKRGDRNTVKMHIESLTALAPEVTELYRLLGEQTMRMLGDYSVAEEIRN